MFSHFLSFTQRMEVYRAYFRHDFNHISEEKKNRLLVDFKYLFLWDKQLSFAKKQVLFVE
jgi:hypothetical protein